MKRIGILTAGGDTPALNATIYGAVERANALGIEVFGIIHGFQGLLDPRVPHVHLNPLFSTIPELNPTRGGTIIGASRTYIGSDRAEELQKVRERIGRLKIEGLICIGGDGTITGMQPIADFLPCVLAPKTIDNDLGLNYLDEPNDWVRKETGPDGQHVYQKETSRDEIALDDIINYATPGYATAVFVVAQGVKRLRSTAESHSRIGIVEVMGRESGYISLGSAYGQPDIILTPEVPLQYAKFEQRVREVFELQKHVIVVVGEGVMGPDGQRLGDDLRQRDQAGNMRFDGAAEELKSLLEDSLGEKYLREMRGGEPASSAIFTRKVGHTQRGGRPIRFDRFHATQLGGKALELIAEGRTNVLATLQWSTSKGFFVDSLAANKLCDPWNVIRPRQLHASMYDAQRFKPSRIGVEYLRPIFNNAIGSDDLEEIRSELFNPSHLTTRYQSVNIDIQKRTRYLSD